MVDLWPGMEIGGEAVVAGCCGEELLLWLVDGERAGSLSCGQKLPLLEVLLLELGLLAVGEKNDDWPREGKVPAAVLAGEEGAAERERGRGEVALCRGAVRRGRKW
ncbi:hypothetical protein Peur_000737 [Populus x canadensis]